MNKLNKKNISRTVITFTGALLAMINLTSCPSTVRNKSTAYWAGVRSSEYGFKYDLGRDKYPSPAAFDSYVDKISSYYDNSRGALVWIVGSVGSTGKDEKGEDLCDLCKLTFPKPDELDSKNLTYENIVFSDYDRNETYLTEFDKKGYDVWLQVESGNADLVELAEIVMTKYKKHKCVKGFGIDVEWIHQNGTNGYGKKLSDSTAAAVDSKVKSFNKNYSVFVKHWDSRWLPSKYPVDMIFVNDSQGYGSISEMQSDFKKWSEKYYPNPVFFQIGYEADEDLWSKLEKPVRDLGAKILEVQEETVQKKGIIWVDFTVTRALRY